MKAWQVARLRRERQLFAERRAHSGRMLSGFGGFVVSSLLVMLAFGAAGGAAFAIYSANAASFEPPEEAIAKLPRGGAKVYDRNGALLYEFVDQQNGVRRPVSLNQVSDWVIEATIATEDPSFYNNVGVNVRGLARAGYENFMPEEGDEFFTGSGGSSITQQLAKNVYIPREERAERSITRKIRETVIALELTERYEKDQILEWYLNTIPYGGIYVGIEAAAEGYFGKSASDLTLAEAALLAGIPQAPGRYDPFRNFALAKARQEEVLRLMVKHNSISQAEAERAAAEPLELHDQQFILEAPHFVLGRVANEIRARFGERALYNDGLKITTTLDLRLQHKAQEVMEKWISEHEASTNTHNGALMAMLPRTGEVLVYLGSRDYFDDSIQGNNDNIVALNSPGSTLKPFTYMTTFTKGWGTGTPIPDVPMSIRDEGSGQVFSPTNPGNRYSGLVTAAEALGNSLNVPALQAILYAGVDDTVEMLRRVGYTTFDDRSRYGPALTLGGTDIKLEESVIGYSVLANRGVMAGAATVFEREPGERTIDPAILLKVEDADGKVLYEFEEPDTERVVSEALAYMPVSILSDPANTRITWSTPNPLVLKNGMPSVAKTGTSEPYPNSKKVGETWTLGFTTEIVTGIWAGNTDNEPIDNIYSRTIAWNAWNEFMIAAHEILELEGKPFERPAEGLVERRVNGRPSLFLEGGSHVTGDWWRSADNRQVNYEGRIPDLRSDDRRDRQDDEQNDEQDREQQDQQQAGVSFATITSPGDGQVVSGRVAITGTAVTPGFSSMTVDVLQGSSSARLATSDSPSAGVLAVWDTTGLPNGQYALRLTVQDAEHGTIVSTINVTVQN